MNKRNLCILLSVTVLLALLYFASAPAADHSGPIEPVRLLADVPGEQIRKISLEKGSESFELEYKDGAWTIPSRGNYLANAGKVRSLMLKLLDLSTTQKVPATDDGLKKLGLDEEGVKGQYARVRFYGDGGKELGGLFLGKARSAGKPGEAALSAMPMNGQYVRRINDNTIYLVGLPVNVLTELTNWLESNLVNILPSGVYKVVESEVAPGGERKPIFELIAAEKKEKNGPAVHTLVGDVPVGEEVHAAAVSQVSSGLENLSIADVHRADAPEVKDAVFDRETRFYLTTGVTYTITTAAAKDDKVFGKITVAYDADLAKEMEARNLKAAAEATPTPAATPAADSKKDKDKGDNDEDSPAAAAKDEKKAELATPEDAKKRTEQFAPWVYEFASYQGTKFRKARADLLKKKDEEKKPAAGAPPEFSGMPPELTGGMPPQ